MMNMRTTFQKNRKDLTLRTKKDHSNESSSDDDFKHLIRKFKKFIKQESKKKNELKKKRLPKKKKVFKVTWDESSASKDEKQTNESEVANYALVAFDDEVCDSIETSLLYNKLLDAFHDLYDEFKLVGKKYKLLKKNHTSISSKFKILKNEHGNYMLTPCI